MGCAQGALTNNKRHIVYETGVRQAEEERDQDAAFKENIELGQARAARAERNDEGYLGRQVRVEVGPQFRCEVHRTRGAHGAGSLEQSRFRPWWIKAPACEDTHAWHELVKLVKAKRAVCVCVYASR